MHSPENQTRYLLLVAGLGGLLYGIDVGIIAGALPYLEASAVQLWKLSRSSWALWWRRCCWVPCCPR
jgi:hypothetical protein